MKGTVLSLICALFVFVNVASAQEMSKMEIFGGYSHMSHHIGLNGWIASADYNPWEHIGFEGSLSGHYGTDHILDIPVDTTIYNFNVGPRVYAATSQEKLTAFGHLLFGFSHLSGSTLGVNESDTSFSWVLGGGVDYGLFGPIAARGQIDLVRTNFFNNGESDGRYSVGLVYRFSR